MNASLQDRARAEALLRNPQATVAAVGPRALDDRPALRLRKFWWGVTLAATVAGAMHFHHGTSPSPTPASDPPSTTRHVVSPPSAATTTTRYAPPSIDQAVNRLTQRMSTTSLKAATPVSISPPPPTPVEQASLAQPTSANVAPPLLVLPVTVDPTDTSLTLARKLEAQGQHFPALAVSVEELRTKVYYDGCGANVGIGYCINHRIAEYGADHVRHDMQQAGIAPSSIDALMSGQRHRQQQVEITKTQALRLLFVVAPEYLALARDAVGPTFDHLPSYRQVAIQWLAYNTGNIGEFKGLVHSVQRNDVKGAMDEITPWYRDPTTHAMVKNERAGAYLQAAYVSAQGLRMAVTDSIVFEDRTLNHRESPIVVADPAMAKTLQRQGQMPSSPLNDGATKPTLTSAKLNAWLAAPPASPNPDQATIDRLVRVAGPSP